MTDEERREKKRQANADYYAKNRKRVIALVIAEKKKYREDRALIHKLRYANDPEYREKYEEKKYKRLKNLRETRKYNKGKKRTYVRKNEPT